MRHYPPTRRREVQASWTVFFIGISLVFLISAMSGAFTMPAEVYGAAVIMIPAELWAMTIFLSTSLHFVGISMDQRWRWSPVPRVAGTILHLGCFQAFMFLSIAPSFGDIVTIFSAGFSVMWMWFLVLNVLDLCDALRLRE